MKKTLVIHPDDPTTDFLKVLYKDLPDCEVVRDPSDRKLLLKKVKKADRVICLGHGLPQGMLGMKNRVFTNGFCIDAEFVPYFKKQPNNIYIWCNADVFVKEHKLSGFSTGMFISEIHEAHVYRVKTTWDQVSKSNELFAKNMNVALRHDLSMRALTDFIVNRYMNYNGNMVIEYNRPRLALFENGRVIANSNSYEYGFIY